MKSNFFIEKHSVHLWQGVVPELLLQIKNYSHILTQDEVERAERYRFEEHRQRFIVSRALLRLILALYTEQDPQTIVFTLGQHGKPYLHDNASHLQFNVSHSHDRVVLAIRTEEEIGIDIEKIEQKYKKSVAERFFSPQEVAALSALPDEKKISAFYHIWAGKEAIIKALGLGLYAPLSQFSLDVHASSQTVQLMHEHHEYHYYLTYFSVHPGYQSAFATLNPVNKIQNWQWTLDGPINLNVVS